MSRSTCSTADARLAALRDVIRPVDVIDMDAGTWALPISGDRCDGSIVPPGGASATAR